MLLLKLNIFLLLLDRVVETETITASVRPRTVGAPFKVSGVGLCGVGAFKVAGVASFTVAGVGCFKVASVGLHGVGASKVVGVVLLEWLVLVFLLM